MFFFFYPPTLTLCLAHFFPVLLLTAAFSFSLFLPTFFSILTIFLSHDSKEEKIKTVGLIKNASLLWFLFFFKCVLASIFPLSLQTNLK